MRGIDVPRRLQRQHDGRGRHLQLQAAASVITELPAPFARLRNIDRQGGRLLVLPMATPTAREHAQHLDTPGAFEPPRRFGIGLSRLDELQQATIELGDLPRVRSEEHTSELQSLMRSSYAVFCLKTKKNTT